MPRVTVLPNGVTASCPRQGPLATEPVKRGRIGGWSTQATRRLRRWFYSVDGPALDAHGHAITLTIRDLPPTARDWTTTRATFVKRMRRAGMIRGQWLTEWQRRGVPHLHGMLFMPEPGMHEIVTGHWLAAAAEWGAGESGQSVMPVWGLSGWLQYQAKHSARGVRHYQRANVPEAWQGSTGRLWGVLGDWPVREEVIDVEQRTYWRFRRSLRGWLLSRARAGEDHRRVAYLRRMLSDPERDRSAVRAVGEFCPEEVSWRLLHASLLDAEPHDERPHAERRVPPHGTRSGPASGSPSAPRLDIN